MAFGSPAAFPTTATIGRPYTKFHQFQPNLKDVTHRHDYDDGGASFVLFNDTGIIRWLVVCEQLTVAQAAFFDAHYVDAGGEAFGFSLTNPITATVYTDVHYDQEYEEDHSKRWINRRVMHLIKRPA